MFTRRGLSGLTAGIAALAATPAAAAGSGAATPAELKARLAALPVKRDFKTVPLVLDTPSQWDDRAIREVAAYRGGPRQVWDAKDLAGSWTGFLRNSLNGQVLSFRNANFLTVGLARGEALLLLLDQAAWDKYAIGKLTGAKPINSAIVAGSGDNQDASIPTLMKRGAVFMACHNAIWAAAGRIVAAGGTGTQEEITADLTNHLVPGVILTPGALATLPLLQDAGFHYVT